MTEDMCTERDQRDTNYIQEFYKIILETLRQSYVNTQKLFVTNQHFFPS